MQDVKPDAAKAKDDCGGTHLNLCRVDDSAHARGNAAANVADLVKGRILPDLGQGYLRQHRIVREGRAAHIMVNGFALVGKPRGAIGHQALALRDADFLAQVGLWIEAIFAFAAFRRVERDDMVALLERGHPLANFHHNACALMAHDGGKQPFRISAGNGELIGVANTRCLDFHQNLALLGAFQIDFNNFQGFTGFKSNGGAGFHGVCLKFMSVVGFCGN